MVNSKAKGITTELLCQAYLSSLGYNVSVPIGEDCRYDMILDVDGKLLRIQVKSCVEKNQCLKFSTHSITTSGKYNVIHKYSKHEIDYFAIFYDDQCYLIPIELCSGNSRSLSFSKKRVNGESRLYIEDFTAEAVINSVLQGNDDVQPSQRFIVCQHDLNTGETINSFTSYTDAGLHLGKPPCHISQCARGLRRSAYGYSWSLVPCVGSSPIPSAKPQ